MCCASSLRGPEEEEEKEEDVTTWAFSKSLRLCVVEGGGAALSNLRSQSQSRRLPFAICDWAAPLRPDRAHGPHDHLVYHLYPY